VWHDMMAVQIPILEKILRTIFVYLTLIILFRIAGKRTLAAFDTFDFVVIFLLSNVVQNAIIGDDNSLLGGIIGAVVLVAVNAAVSRWIATSPRAALILEGTPTTIIKDGQFIPRALAHLSLRPETLESAIRLQNGDSVREISTGTMEPSGQLILSIKPEEQNASKADITELASRLDRIESALAAIATAR
jgi:uncharacterized membrane protein YcaP (DUF421 family)